MLLSLKLLVLIKKQQKGRTIELAPRIKEEAGFESKLCVVDVWLHCSKSNVTAEKVKMKRLDAALLSDIDSVWWSYFLILKDNVHSLYKQTACKSYQCMGDLNKCCVLFSALLWPYRSGVESFTVCEPVSSSSLQHISAFHFSPSCCDLALKSLIL